MNNKLTIRLARKNDLPEIVAIYNQAILKRCFTADLETFTIEEREPWFSEHQDPGYPLYVGVIDNKIIGYAYLSPYRNKREGLIKTAEVSYYVDENNYRQGVGSELLHTLILSANDLKYKTLIAILFSTNTGSIRLLTKFHFEEWGKIYNALFIDNEFIDHVYFGLTLEHR